MDSNSKKCHVDHILMRFRFVPRLNVNFICLLVAKKIDELQEVLRKKDEDMKQMEQRYKRYVEKARTVSPPSQWVKTSCNRCLMGLN